MTVATGARVRVEVEPFYPYLLRLYGISGAEFEALADEDLKAEYLDGVMIVHSPAYVRHEERRVFLLTLLRFYTEAYGVGDVVGGNALFRTGPWQFAPDVVVVGREARVTAKRVEGVPLLMIEILSESTRDYDLGEKRNAYREIGVSEIWWVDPEKRAVIIDRGSSGYRYREEVMHEGWVVSEAVPGFRIRVEWLWQEPLPSVVQCWEEIQHLQTGG